MFSDIIILAGGFGERLWPASRPDFPKQFLSVSKGISFLQNALLRAAALKPEGKIIIAAREGLQKEIANQCISIAEKSDKYTKEKILNDTLIIAEPEAKHTTAPIILCCRLLNILFPEIKHDVIVLTSDHIIEPIENFVSDAKKAYGITKKSNFVTFGIKPYEAATGYGYIQTECAEDAENTIFKIKSFKEKPNAESAKKYLEEGNCWWNSGMFAFSCDFFIKELEICTPEIAKAFSELPKGDKPVIEKINGISSIKSWQAMNNAYSKTPAEAIDIAVAEKTKHAYTVIASFDWDDAGSWDSFAKYSTGEGAASLIQSKDCFVYSDIPVSICGIDGINVIIKNGKALIIKKGEGSLVREALKHFPKN